MRRGLALALVFVAAGCGSHASNQGATTGVATKASQPRQVRVTISAPTHHPRVKAKWPVTVHVTNAAGQPIAARLTMRILFAGSPVGKVDFGRVYHFVGSWREKKGEEITWPAASRGQPLAFQAIVTAHHVTVKRTFPVTPQ